MRPATPARDGFDLSSVPRVVESVAVLPVRPFPAVGNVGGRREVSIDFFYREIFLAA